VSDGTGGKTLDDALVGAVEAVLFAAGEPVHPREIAAAFEGESEARIEEAMETLRRRHAEGSGGLQVERVAGAFRLATRQDVGPWVRRFFRQRNRTRLSPAALETLAIVAYRQPVTSPEIQAIRGVDPGAALKSLLEKKMIRILGRKKVVGNPLLYGTSRQFLVHFGLNALEDLPSIGDFEQFLGALDGMPAPLFGAGEGRIEADDAVPGDVLEDDGAAAPGESGCAATGTGGEAEPPAPDSPEPGEGAR
jgi:segregation and condensation protein B